MLRALLARFRARFGERDDGGEDEETWFLPSRLDASVLFAHGLGRGGAERELDEIEERARDLEEHRRDE